PPQPPPPPPTAAGSTSKTLLMVQFHEHIISDLLEDPHGGLVVLSAGLALPKLISSLLHLHHPSQGSLLILNASPPQKISIFNELTTNSSENISSITSELPAHNRLSLYTSGGISFITARILIVDLLTRRLPTTSVAGIVILNAHSISDTSTEAFIVRILRSTNRNFYVRAISDRPQAMVSGFAKAERILKCLFIRKLHLWPRFQVYVSQDLERDPPEVIDVRVPMSPYMVGIQKAVLEVMDACLKEMKKTNKVDVEDLTVENGLFKSFDEIVRRQLDPIWHTLGKRTKQLVSDLKTMRKLLDYLARYDAVTYLKYLDSLRASESFRSVWIFAESSYKIFEYAKKRVYRFGKSDGEKLIAPNKTASNKKRKFDEKNKDGDVSSLKCVDSSASTNSGVVLEETLEEPPKWKVLLEILVEIQDERQKQAMAGEDLIVGDDRDQNGIVLVACKDEHSCMQLEDCIIRGPHKVMLKEWKQYLLSKVELQALPKFNKKKPKAPKGFGVLDGVMTSVSGQKAEVSSVSKQENDALLAAAYEIRKQAKKDTAVVDGGASEELGKRSREERKKKMVKTDPQSETSIQSETPEKNINEGVLKRHDYTAESTSQLPSVHFHALESDQSILDVLQPSVIIVYHPDMAFVREIEVYKSQNPAKKLKVYFLFYEDSTEVQKFDSSVRRENGAFESLIRQKSLMMLAVGQDEQFLGVNSSLETQSGTAQNLITRKAGGKKEAEKEMQSVSDIGDDVTPNSIISKLSLLVLHFPRLRIVWSRSLHATAEIFATLKANQDEPDEVKAIRVGVPSEEGIIENDVSKFFVDRAENFNTSAVEFLRRLPGVTDSNYRSIMDACKSLAELALLPLEKLAEMMGGLKAANSLRDFLDAKYPTLL
ncbi:hypothetical protein RD792_009192, partial [Penstemon davidsonii]